jgi:methyl-accepting chemotaxis protein
MVVKVDQHIIDEIVRMRDEEKMTYREIAEKLKELYDVSITEKTISEHYKRAKSEDLVFDDDLHLTREILKLYRQGKSPVDAVVEIEGVTPQMAEKTYAWYLKAEKQYVENIEITKELVRQIFTAKLFDDMSLSDIISRINDHSVKMLKLTEMMHNLRNEVELAASTARNLNSALIRSVEELNEAVEAVTESIKKEDILSRLDELSQQLSALTESVEEIREELKNSKKKGLFRR